MHAARVFVERTFGFQLDRESPFSLWGWGQYRAAGIPDLHLVQQVLEVLVVVGAVALAFVPRRRSPLQLAALSAAVLIAFADLFMMITPEFASSGENLHMLTGEHESHFFIHWLDLAAPLAIGGLWLWMFFGQLRQRPMLAVGDPYLRESLASGGGHH